MNKAATVWGKGKYRGSDCCCRTRERSEEISVVLMEMRVDSGRRKGNFSVLLLFLLLILILPSI
ncbi:hypothetical protein SLEP1_g50266 [Rubroshorea leprosula]|uniref:Transmembrane protein n=1 Tax=Rubroshorea leprosula TaxID=152421 RepID=A0AAV5LZG2_9ROSI|nr:hypothetical protein SLEP1_g50266 [Rubroshorea leprosula]